MSSKRSPPWSSPPFGPPIALHVTSPSIARPIPVPAPVTTTCFPVMSPLSFAICVLSVDGSPCRTLPPSVDCRCAEHGTRLGRSPPGRPYAEAEGQPGRWTKAHPARRNHGPFLSRAQASSRKLLLCEKKRTQSASFAIASHLTTRWPDRSVPCAPRKERLRLMALRQAVASAAVGWEAGRGSPRSRCAFSWTEFLNRMAWKRRLSQFATHSLERMLDVGQIRQ